MKLLPREPTEGMLDIGEHVLDVALGWQAMYDAAPSEPTELVLAVLRAARDFLDPNTKPDADDTRLEQELFEAFDALLAHPEARKLMED